MKNLDINNLRENYNLDHIDFSNVRKNPIDLFIDWFNFEKSNNYKDVNACVLSTVNSDNIPSSRVVLLKYLKNDKFIFFTNYDSNKGKEISYNNNVCLNFFWVNSERQVRINGKATKISEDDSDDYFNARPIESQIGACVSSQSEIIDIDHDFTNDIEHFKLLHKNKKIKRPNHWGGYSIIPHKIEFWQGRPSRLHDRLLYEKCKEDWIFKRLSA